jgi:hypothetical protein
MEDADFHELRYQPLQVQLERLFGEEADGYLNPTVKESPRKVFDLGIAKKSKLIHPGFCQRSILCFSSKSCKPLTIMYLFRRPTWCCSIVGSIEGILQTKTGSQRCLNFT